MHKGTAGDLSRMLTHEREDLSDKLTRKQQELLECRRHFADMGFRSDGKTLHPTVQRAVYFNDALIAAQKERVNRKPCWRPFARRSSTDEDLGQYLIDGGRHRGAGNVVEQPGAEQPRCQHADQSGTEPD